MKRFLTSRIFLPLMAVMLLCGAIATALAATALMTTHAAASKHPAKTTTVPFYIQKLDSCREAIGGATFRLTGNGLTETRTVAKTKPITVSRKGDCPIQHGDCARVPAGCVSFDIPVPTTGTKTYTITEITPPAHFVPCVRRTCPHGPEVITLTIKSSGKITATTHDPNSGKTYPLNGKTFSGSKTDPALVYDYQVGKKGKGKGKGKGK